ncbi:hypothetical protein [Thermoflexus sp.]|uniref:hypothetical protein n=1 Tax=Thermoflexus sp. TaxID=1969742 RepID=UPI0035E3F745
MLTAKGPGSARLQAAGRILALMLLIVPSSARGPLPLTLAPPRAPETLNPKVGVHTRVTDETDPSRIYRTFEMARAMGAAWVVEFFPWPYLEPEPDHYAWEHSDLRIFLARREGLKIIARMGMVPAWARPWRAPATYLGAEAVFPFARFVAAFAARYRSQIAALVIWNEPNLYIEWGARPPDPGAFVALMKAVYPAVKLVAPDLPVLAGGPAPTLEDSPHAMNDLRFLREVYERGIAAYIDGWAMHPYGFGNPPEEPPDPRRLNFRRVELMRAIMQAYGDDRPIYITETGWNESPEYDHGLPPEVRADYTVRAYEYARRNWPWCPVVAMWALRYPWREDPVLEGYAFLDLDFRPRPVYETVRRYTHGERSIDTDQ